jgi:hypothetical protein
MSEPHGSRTESSTNPRAIARSAGSMCSAVSARSRRGVSATSAASSPRLSATSAGSPDTVKDVSSSHDLTSGSLAIFSDRCCATRSVMPSRSMSSSRAPTPNASVPATSPGRSCQSTRTPSISCRCMVGVYESASTHGPALSTGPTYDANASRQSVSWAWRAPDGSKRHCHVQDWSTATTSHETDAQ